MLLKEKKYISCLAIILLLALLNSLWKPLLAMRYMFIPTRTTYRESSWRLIEPWFLLDFSNVNRHATIHFNYYEGTPNANIAVCYGFMGRYSYHYDFTTNWDSRTTLVKWRDDTRFIAPMGILDNPAKDKKSCDLSLNERIFIDTAQAPGDFKYYEINKLVIAVKDWKVFLLVNTYSPP